MKSEKKESGQALVEFAFVLIPLLVIVFGIIQFGLIFNGQITVTSAAREGARLAVVDQSVTVAQRNTNVENKVNETAVALLLKVVSIDIDRTDPEKISVKVDGTVDIIVPLLNMITGPTRAVSSESIMRVEVATP